MLEVSCIFLTLNLSINGGVKADRYDRQTTKGGESTSFGQVEGGARTWHHRSVSAVQPPRFIALNALVSEGSDGEVWKYRVRRTQCAHKSC